MTSIVSKFCNECKQERLETDFYIRKKDNTRQVRCKYCYVERTKSYRLNPENRNAILLSSRKHNYKRNYGLTIEQVELMKISQNYKCKICKRQKKLAVDHCHLTKKVRGMLCFSCNTLLGSIENKEKFKEVEIYLGYKTSQVY